MRRKTQLSAVMTLLMVFNVMGVALVGLGAVFGAGGLSQIPKIGQALSKFLLRSPSRTGRVITPASSTAVSTPGGFAGRSLIKTGAKIAGAGVAFEAGSRLLPGGASFPGGDISLSPVGLGGGGGGFGGGESLQPGSRFGTTFITQVWEAPVGILHGMLADGRRFSTRANGTLKVWRPTKNIVIGANPRLSDAAKVARASQKMLKSARVIAKVTGHKVVRQG